MNIRYIIYIIVICSSANFLKASNSEILGNLISNVISNHKSEIGVAVIINSTDTISINNDVQYPLMSVFKFHQAFAIAKHLQTKNIPLDSVLNIKKGELNPNTYSPLFKKYPNKDLRLSIKDLLTYTLQLSDNNACDILFNHVINPEKTDSVIKSTGVGNFSIAATEQDMQNFPTLCYKNWSTPLSSTILLDKLLSDSVISDKYKSFIIQTMIESKTGENRIPAKLQNTKSAIGHKTGTSGKDSKGRFTAVNDIGFVIMPDGNYFCISIYIKDTEEGISSCESVISSITKTVYDYILKGNNKN